MCIDIEFVTKLLRYAADKLEEAQRIANEPIQEDMSAQQVEEQLKHSLHVGLKTIELIQVHVQGVYNSEGHIDWDALVHSVL